VSGSETKSTPRWEWRAFDGDLATLESIVGPSALVEPHRSQEIYLLNASTLHSAKIRGGSLEIKRLKQVDANGLELWSPAFKGAFPLSSQMLREAFSALGLPPPIFRHDSYTLELFLTEIIASDAAFRPVEVSKARRQFVVGGCMAELVRVNVIGVELVSFCIEDEMPEPILSVLREFGLDSRANVSFPNGLKRALSSSARGRLATSEK
jgi:exopolyphosphatase/guanosine-5'-triphosphate,3'-diphosphate pyrophosphatase